MKTLLLFISMIVAACPLRAQVMYDFASTGQQQLLINPAFCAGSNGLQLQSLAAFRNHVFSNYTGVAYSAKGFGIGISNTALTQNYTGDGYSFRYTANQTDLSLAYKIKLGTRVSLIPALQGSFFTQKTRSGDSDYNGNEARTASFSTGLLLNVNQVFTVGAALYYAASASSPSYFDAFTPTEVIHASALLFKDKKVNLQPYALVKVYGNEGFAELGAFTTYKFFTLQTAMRVGDIYNDGFSVGLNARLGILKVGYTFFHSQMHQSFYNPPFHEVYLAMRLFGHGARQQRALMPD